MRIAIVLMVLSGHGFHTVNASRAQSPANSQACPEYDRIGYQEPDADALRNITVEALPGSGEAPAAGRGLQRTPQGTAWFAMREPDTTKPGPWSTSIDIIGNKARKVRLRVRLGNHISGGVRANWLNEKLLWVQVWRGRIASTDMILDVDARRFIYRQDANYNSLIVPCSMKSRDRQ